MNKIMRFVQPIRWGHVTYHMSTNLYQSSSSTLFTTTTTFTTCQNTATMAETRPPQCHIIVTHQRTWTDHNRSKTRRTRREIEQRAQGEGGEHTRDKGRGHTRSGPSVASRLTPIICRAIGSVTEFRLSSAFSCFGHLWNIFALFLQSSSIEIVSLDCGTSAESCSILQSMVLPSLQMLSIVTHDNGLPLIPASFIRHHPRLKTALLLNLHSWDAPDSLCLTPMHLSLPALSHLMISSNYSSFEIQDCPDWMSYHL